MSDMAIYHQVCSEALNGTVQTGYPAPRHEESELVIMIAVRDRRDTWVEPMVLIRRDYVASLGWSSSCSTRAKWRSSPRARCSVFEKRLTPPTLSERRFNDS